MKSRAVLSWACYWAGDAVYRVFDHPVIDRVPGWARLYVRLMQWAVEIQGDGPDGPWESVSTKSPDNHITETVR